MPAESISVVIAEDHALVREGTKEILERDPRIAVVGEAADGSAALEETRLKKPDVLLLDIRMPGLSAVEITHRICAELPETAVLVLSAYDDDDLITALVEAGAMGYLLKTSKPGQLVEAVQRVSEGENVFHPAVAQKIATLWAQGRHTGGGQPTLTEREMEVLRSVCQGMHNKEIAESLGLSVRTVEGHLNEIFARLGVRSRTEAAMYAASRGWFREDGAGN